MNSTRSKRLVRATLVTPAAVAIVLWVIALVVCAVLFVSGGNATSHASTDLELHQTVLGMPVFVAFRHDGRIGVHVQWGLLVLALGPAVIGIVLSVVGLRRTISVRD